MIYIKTLPIKNRICVVTGHYGSGKTNIVANIAFELKSQGKNVTVVDLDIVNPYFRSADFKNEFEEKGIKTILPIYANTNLDIPALPAQVNSIFDDDDSMAIVDVGGDDAGAIALGRYANEFEKCGYDLFYVINGCRYLTRKPSEAIELLKDIEAVSRLKATALINNTNLADQTTDKTIEDSFIFADEVSRLSGLPIAFTTAPDWINSDKNDFFKVKIFVKSPW